MPKKNEIHDPVHNYYYDVIFVYESEYDYRLVYEVEIDFDLENNQRELRLKTTDSYDLDHNFGDISLVILHIYDRTGQIQRRECFEVRLSKYNQKYGTDKSLDRSEIHMVFLVDNHYITDSDSTDAQPLESWIKDWFRNRRIDRLME